MLHPKQVMSKAFPSYLETLKGIVIKDIEKHKVDKKAMFKAQLHHPQKSFNVNTFVAFQISITWSPGCAPAPNSMPARLTMKSCKQHNLQTPKLKQDLHDSPRQFDTAE